MKKLYMKPEILEVYHKLNQEDTLKIFSIPYSKFSKFTEDTEYQKNIDNKEKISLGEFYFELGKHLKNLEEKVK